MIIDCANPLYANGGEAGETGETLGAVFLAPEASKFAGSAS